MFIGGYVSASGVGLTCPKWPLCPKGLIPMKEFIIEYFHRTVAITTSLLIFLTTISIIRVRRTTPNSIQVSSIIAACLAVVQISLGGIVIVEKLTCIISNHTFGSRSGTFFNDPNACSLCLRGDKV